MSLSPRQDPLAFVFHVSPITTVSVKYPVLFHATRPFVEKLKSLVRCGWNDHVVPSLTNSILNDFSSG